MDCLSCGKKIPSKNTKYCNNKCQADYQYKQYILGWKQNGVQGTYKISQHLRRFLFEKYNNRCMICGWSEINPYTGNIPLEVEHIDGNYLNCIEENLGLLCPNCHSLTSTYKGANKGNGRKGRDKYNL